MRIEKYFLLYGLLFFSVLGWSQNQKIDSLVSALQKSRNDIDKAELLNAIADQYKTSDPKLMLDYAQKAFDLAQNMD